MRLRDLSFVFALALLLPGLVTAQDEISGSSQPLDRSLRTGFEFLSQKKYADARISFETSLQTFRKSPQRSEWLFSKITLPDENPSDATSKNSQVRQITLWRHTMGTEQAITTFIAYTYQLEGNKAQADKYFDAVYKLQSPLWGLSWRTFIPLVQGVFHLAVPEENNINFARYLYLSGLLIEDSGQDGALAFFEKAQAIAPKDPEITANLASSYVVRLRAAEAKNLAQISLAADPKQGRVLIDLATAEWLLGELANSEKHALEAATLRPDLPGPHATLALLAIVKNDLVKALKEAEIGVKLSERHPYYLAIQAIAFEVSGKKNDADKTIREAWNRNYPSEEQLKKWFLKDKPLAVLMVIIKRQPN